VCFFTLPTGLAPQTACAKAIAVAQALREGAAGRRKENVNTVLVDRVEMRGDGFVCSKAGATQRAQRGTCNVIVS
jgi:hypothetical protein